MLHILLFLILSISPRTQPEQLFVASDSLFDKDRNIDPGSRDGWRFQAGENLPGVQARTTFTIELPIT